MRRASVEALRDPLTLRPLELRGDGDPVRDGELVADGVSYAIRDGIPRLVGPIDPNQQQTSESFDYKWRRRDTYESDSLADVARAWFLQRYGFDSVEAMRAHFATGRFLDAGCGSGFSAGLWTRGWADSPEYWAVDISAAIDVAQDRLSHLDRAEFVQADVLQLPFADETFDAAIAEGVLHHTPSTREALASMTRVVRRGGEVCFYVYRRKAPAREFTDDHVRGLISGLPPDEAWEQLRPLTELGRVLAELHAEVDVPDIPVLGIRAGRYDVQRLIYWNFAKLFWNENVSFDENLHVNFDWYHPRYAHRQSEDEIREWCRELDLKVDHFNADDAGYTVRAVRA
jgi:SAM-dependent methyltransferase